VKAIESPNLTDEQEAQIERESMLAAMENGIEYWDCCADAPKYALKDVKKIASAIVEELGRRGIADRFDSVDIGALIEDCPGLANRVKRTMSPDEKGRAIFEAYGYLLFREGNNTLDQICAPLVNYPELSINWQCIYVEKRRAAKKQEITVPIEKKPYNKKQIAMIKMLYMLQDIERGKSDIDGIAAIKEYEFLQGKPENWFNRNHIRYCGSCDENIYLRFEWFHEAERAEYCPFCGERI
jgi:hypothetical protein